MRLLLKSIILFVSLFSLINSVQSQNDSPPLHMLKTEFGSSFTGNGDLTGNTLKVSYSANVFKNGFLGPYYEKNSFHNNELQGFGLLQDGDKNSFGLGLDYYLINGKTFNWIVGSGISYNFWRWIYATGPNTGYYDPGNNIRLNPNEVEVWTAEAFGYSVSTQLIVNLNRHFGISINANYQNDTVGYNIGSLLVGCFARF